MSLTSFFTGEALGMGKESIPSGRFSCPTALSSSPQWGRSHLSPPGDREQVPSTAKVEDHLHCPERWVRIFTINKFIKLYFQSALQALRVFQGIKNFNAFKVLLEISK